MKQVVQSVSGGPVRVVEVPRPSIRATEVLVETLYSVISPGTERAVTDLAQSNLIAKARARPDLVRQAIKKAKIEGISRTVRSVRTRLEEDLPLGYSASGIVRAVGEAVQGISPGQIVATGGAGKANHAEFQAVPALLASSVPDGVDPAEAAFATIGSIALHSLRLADIQPGASVVVVGLGLVGQLTARLAIAAGCSVAGLDLESFQVDKARMAGIAAHVDNGEPTTKAILDFTRGRGADAVIMTASSKSSAAMLRAPALCRDRALVVVVGDTGLDLDRSPLYEKEITLRFARSYGPGRYEMSYEDWGVDYPAGYVRWTEGRNLEAFLDLLHHKRLQVADLITHRFELQRAPEAFELVQSRNEPVLGICLSYASMDSLQSPIIVGRRKSSEKPAVGLIGAGSFARTTLIPSLRETGFERFVSVSSASGLSAKTLASRGGFEKAVSGSQEVIEDSEIDVLVIATPHDSHAALTVRALNAGKHVFCEKPVAISLDELEEVEAAWRSSGCVLFVGFNRRWSPAISEAKGHLASSLGPLTVTYRVNAGPIPPGHWYRDRRNGGRLIGEVCHFIDTCSSLVEAPVMSVDALGGNSIDHDDCTVNISYEDLSIAAITYASGGHATTPKERIEILGRERSIVIEDFKSVTLDGKALAPRRQDKGHKEQAAAFMRAIRDGHPVAVGLESSRTTLLAAESAQAQFSSARLDRDH